MNNAVLQLVAVIVWIFIGANVVPAQSNFYEGKTIRIIVGFSPGGGYDALARMLSRHMPKYIPGHPTILVENMTGAGSLLAANHIFKVAKPDGLTFGHFSGGFAYSQVMGQPGIEFDVQKFVFVGAVARDESAIALTKASGINSMEKWFAAKTPVKLGTTGPGAFGTDNVDQSAQGGFESADPNYFGIQRHRRHTTRRGERRDRRLDLGMGFDARHLAKSPRVGHCRGRLADSAQSISRLGQSPAGHRPRQDCGSETTD